MKRFVSLILSVCFLFSINTVSYAANISSRKASNPVIQSMNDKYLRRFLLLFSVHPKPKGRKVDKMLTLKKVKELVGAPSHAKRTPSPKMLYEEGIVLLRREFDQGSHLTVYNSGYVLFSAGKRNTVLDRKSVV